MQHRTFRTSGPSRGRRPYHASSSRGGFRRGQGRPAQKRGMGEHIDHARFINKAVAIEEIAPYVPEHAFVDFAIDAELKQAIVSKGYVTPTPIQDRVIPHILRGEDVVGIANTGTGKTAAFLIPLIDKVRRDKYAKALIVVPTRELANQIQSELKGFTNRMQIFSVCCVGGANINRQLSELRHHNNFIIGTPGRLKDLIDRGRIDLATFSTIVLDEADRMLDMGFINDMRFLMAGMPAKRHTLFFSATMSPEIERLISEFLTNPARISVKTGDTSKNVEQDVIKVLASGKFDMLSELLRSPDMKKVLVFGRTKHGVEKLSRLLESKGITAASIHGNKSQPQRERALKAFRDERVQVLVATDVAARGLDIPDVSHVINYDIPSTYDDYVHRIGRTGRGEKRGKALTFIEHRHAA